MNKDFLDGIEFGCMAGALWYIHFILFALVVHYKTGNVYYALGMLSLGGILVWFLSVFVKNFILLKD